PDCRSVWHVGLLFSGGSRCVLSPCFTRKTQCGRPRVLIQVNRFIAWRQQPANGVTVLQCSIGFSLEHLYRDAIDDLLLIPFAASDKRHSPLRELILCGHGLNEFGDHGAVHLVGLWVRFVRGQKLHYVGCFNLFPEKALPLLGTARPLSSRVLLRCSEACQ